MAFETWLVYLVAVLGLSLSPGPNSLLALTHGALHGRRRTLFTIAGGAVGFVVLIALSMFGIGALIAASATGLTLLKWAGGAYLVWLGIQVWRAPPITVDLLANSAADASAALLFRQGLMAAATNPKGLLFFGAFLPHFVDPARGLLLQFGVMAATFIGTEIATEYVLAATAHRVRPWLARVGRRFNRACGGLFIAIGAALPLRA